MEDLAEETKFIIRSGAMLIERLSREHRNIEKLLAGSSAK